MKLPRHTLARWNSNLERVVAAALPDPSLLPAVDWYRVALDGLPGSNTIRKAGVVAALAPRQFWDVNKRAAKACLELAPRPPSIMHRSWSTALDWRDGTDPLPFCTKRAPKSYCFFQNLCGDESVATIDVWAFRILTPQWPTEDLRPIYWQACQVYQNVAARYQLTPAQCQALAWVAVRGRAS